MEGFKIYVAADHAGFALKEKVVSFLKEELNMEVSDCGATELNEGDDYPSIIACAASAVHEGVQNGIDTRAIVFGKSGQGEAMVANRFKGVRCAVYYGGDNGMSIIKLSREHNNANVLSIGAGFVEESDAINAIKEWLSTPFSEEDRHVFRNSAIDEVSDIDEK